jgi:hypothetical protein
MDRTGSHFVDSTAAKDSQLAGDRIYQRAISRKVRRMASLLLLAAIVPTLTLQTAQAYDAAALTARSRSIVVPSLTTPVGHGPASVLLSQLVGADVASVTKAQPNDSVKDNSSEANKKEVGAEATDATTAGASPSTVKSSSGVDAPLRGRLVEDVDSPSSILSDLVKLSLDRDANSAHLQGKSSKYGKGSQKLLQSSKDVANFCTSYKGFERSSEAADIILNEKVKIKSKASAAYAYQRKIDDYNTHIFSALMQMSTGLGTDDAERKGHIIDSAVAELTPLIGEEAAKSALERMKAWSQSLTADASDFAAKPLDIFETEQKVKTAVNGALQNDDVVAEIKDKLHKFNGRSKFMRGTAKIVNTTLSIAMLTPNFISPAAQVAYLAFCVSTGGPEDAKLLTELYLDQRFQSRWKVYNHKAEQAANSYNLSLLSKNPVALKFSQTVLSDMEKGKSGGAAGDMLTLANKKAEQDKSAKAEKSKDEKTNAADSASKASVSL